MRVWIKGRGGVKARVSMRVRLRDVDEGEG